ncbi:hypothetical protein NFI96_010009 [Prochilodus magdalenae]|nr:hypothetical protein NFI96_010009 [Prochilodus magdalenae]
MFGLERVYLITSLNDADMIFRNSQRNLTLLSFNLTEDHFKMMDTHHFNVTRCSCNNDPTTTVTKTTTATTTTVTKTTTATTTTVTKTTTATTTTQRLADLTFTDLYVAAVMGAEVCPALPTVSSLSPLSLTTGIYYSCYQQDVTHDFKSQEPSRGEGSQDKSTLAEDIVEDIGNLTDVFDDYHDSDPELKNNLILIMESLPPKMETDKEELIIETPFLALGIKKLNGSISKTMSFKTTESDLQIDGGPVNGSTLQGSVDFPASLMDNLSPEEKKQASRIQFCFYRKPSLFQNKQQNDSKLISGVLATSVSNLTISNLKDNVIITLKNLESVGDKNVSCQFWNFSLGGSGGWSSNGCTVLNRTENKTVCSCNHLTNFGVLLDISNKSITNYQQVAVLNSLTYIGCGVSSVFLTVTLVMYLRLGKLRKVVPNKILIQLCMALLLLNLVFLLNSFLAQQLHRVGLCIPTTFFLSYFLLASFTWMALESVHIYLSIVKVFNTYVSHFMVKITLVGWGVPLVVVIVPIAINNNIYGLQSTTLDNGSVEYFCWWKDIFVFRLVVGTYFCLTYLLNLSMFIVVMTLLCRIKKQNPHSVRYRTVLQDIWSSTALAVLLGLTWVFGLFSWGSVQLIFTYLFVICNSLQGFFIFVFRCAANEEVRRQYSKKGFLKIPGDPDRTFIQDPSSDIVMSSERMAVRDELYLKREGLKGPQSSQSPPPHQHRSQQWLRQLEHPYTVPADGVVGVEVEGHQAFCVLLPPLMGWADGISETSTPPITDQIVTPTPTVADGAKTTTSLTTAHSNSTTGTVQTNLLFGQGYVYKTLQDLFQQRLDECRPIVNAATSSRTVGSGLGATQSLISDFVRSLVSTVLQNSGQSAETEKQNSILFQDLEVTCNENMSSVTRNDTHYPVRCTKCMVLLQLSQPTNSCCIASVVNTGLTNSTLKGEVFGNQVKRVGLLHIPKEAVLERFRANNEVNTK